METGHGGEFYFTYPPELYFRTIHQPAESLKQGATRWNLRKRLHRVVKLLTE
jgi:hypothetical protein